MTFTIYSIGDSAFLEQILIAIRLVTGNGDFKMMIGIGLLISGLLVCLRALFTGSNRIDYHQLFIGWLVYQSLFVPTTTVTIENVYTGEMSVVDKVPFGVGAAGGIISTIGHGLTKIFDTSFGVIAPGITKANFAESLSLLNDVRRQIHTAAVFEALSKAAGNDFDVHGSWHNYIRECTLTKIDIQSVSLPNLMLQPIDQALRFDSKLYTTQLKSGAGRWQQDPPLNCTDAYNRLAQLTHITNKEVEEEIGKTLGFSTINRASTFNHIANALQAVGASRTSATNFVKNAILEPLYYEAAAGRYQDWQDYNSALMVNQAIQQRNTKWAAEQTMFMTIVRPMLTFFEGFIYAITPLMAFMLVLGNLGIQLLGKYLQTIFWTQLWMPVMSIINMFIHVASTRALAPIAGSSSGLHSMYALDKAGDILQHWIATGGMLAAATPVISLFIVSGSTYAMSGLVGRIAASDGIDTGIAAPAAVQQSAVVAAGSGYAHNQHSGMIASGTESLVPNFNFGIALDHGLSNVSSQLRQSSQSFNQTLGRAINEGVSEEQGYSRVADLGRSIAAQDSEASGFVTEQAKNFSEKFGVHNDHKDFVAGTIAGIASGTFSKEWGGKKLQSVAGSATKRAPEGTTGSITKKVALGAEGKTSSNSQDSATWSTDSISQFANGIKGKREHAQTLTNQLAQRFSDQNRQGAKETWGSTLSQNLARSASDVTSLSQTHSEMSKLQTQIGSATQADLRSLAASVAKDDNASRLLHDHFQLHANSLVKKEAADITSRYQNNMGMDPEVADTAGKMVALSNSTNIPHGERSQALHGVAKSIQMAMGYHPSLAEPQGLSSSTGMGTTPTPLQTQVNQSIGDGPAYRNPDALRTQANTRIPTDGTTVRGQAQENRAALRMQQAQANRQVSAPHVRKAQSHLLHSLPERSFSAKTWGKWDNATDWLCRRLDQLGGGLYAGSQEGTRAFNNAMEQLSSMSPAQREQLLTTLNQGEDALAKSEGKFGTALVSGATKLGLSTLGAAASGYSAAKGWLTGNTNLSEAAKGMSMEQRGAYYFSAFSSALSEGPKAARRFMQEHGPEFKAATAEVAQSRYGLTPGQSAVFAESFDTNHERMAEAVKTLKIEHSSMINPRGETQFDERGQPILSQQESKFTDHLANVIQNATTAGDQAGSYLSAIRGYNIATRRLEE